MKTKTYHDGAQAERKAWMAHIRKLSKKLGLHSQEYFMPLVYWGIGRVERYKKRKGGL